MTIRMVLIKKKEHGDRDDAFPNIKMEMITSLIHHPLPLAPISEAPPPAPMPLMLTTKERKKIKRMKKNGKTKRSTR